MPPYNMNARAPRTADRETTAQHFCFACRANPDRLSARVIHIDRTASRVGTAECAMKTCTARINSSSSGSSSSSNSSSNNNNNNINNNTNSNSSNTNKNKSNNSNNSTYIVEENPCSTNGKVYITPAGKRHKEQTAKQTDMHSSQLNDHTGRISGSTTTTCIVYRNNTFSNHSYWHTDNSLLNLKLGSRNISISACFNSKSKDSICSSSSSSSSSSGSSSSDSRLHRSKKGHTICHLIAAFLAIVIAISSFIVGAAGAGTSIIPSDTTTTTTTATASPSSSAAATAHRTLPGPTCEIGVLMPKLPAQLNSTILSKKAMVLTTVLGTSGTTKAGRGAYDIVPEYSKTVQDTVRAGLVAGLRGLEELKDTSSSLRRQTCNVSYVWHDSGWCDEKMALGRAAALHKGDRTRIIVGPPCYKSFRVVGLLGSYWGIPVLTWEPVLRGVVGEKSYDAVMSTYGAFEDFAQSALTVIHHLRWTKIAMIYEDSQLCDPLIGQLGQAVLDNAHLDEAAKVIVRSWNMSSVGAELGRISQLTRTIVTCTRPRILRSILKEAKLLGMTDGYYAFLHLNFESQPLVSSDASARPIPLDVVLQLGQFQDMPRYRGKKKVERSGRDVGKEKKRIGDEDDNVDNDGQEKALMQLLMNRGAANEETEGVLDSQLMLSPYLHDAMVVAAVASQQTRRDRAPSSFDIGPPYELKTGPISFDEQGVRKATFSLVHRGVGGDMYNVAKILSNLSTTWLDEVVWVGGATPTSDLTCRGNDGRCTDVAAIVAGAVIGSLAFLAALALAVYFYRKHLRRLAAAKKEWLVDDRDVKRRRAKIPMSNGFSGTGGGPSNMETVKRLVRMETRGTLGLGSNCSLDKNMLYAPIGNYKDMVVAVKQVRWTHVQISKREMLEDLTTVKELSHDNVNQFVGAHVSMIPGSSYVLFRYCSKGSLQDVLENDDIKLDWMFKLSFALDLAKGIEYIHRTALRSHGNLKSSNCVIDSRWVLKVTDYGAITSYRKPDAEDDLDNRIYFGSLLWTAPEILRMSKKPHKGTQKGDVYSFGIILQEILFRCAPYFYNYMEPEDIVTLVKNENQHRHYRPCIPPDNELPVKAINLMVACWAEVPETRPDCHQIRKRVRDLNGSKRFNIMDNMLQMLESYSSNLEQLVTDRTEELEAEKRKTDTLLYQMLPPLVAEQLKSGMSVIPESYDHVSIFFSDIVGFTTIASNSRPLEVVDLLNDLYTCFDEVIARRDVYKVETIGDAYMCVSGCPRRNGNRHAGEIANMALDLISAVTHFRIRHKPEERLNLRVGLHTGACAAGVVGRTMPRYCLFGDTVNMASRMESTGKALNIHMSSQMKDALDELDWGFLMVERGFIEVKGKGLQKTFWLAGKKNYKKPLPESLFYLQKSLEEGGSPPTPSLTTLTVGDSMFSALRKTSITVSNITVGQSPCSSDTEDAASAGRGGGATSPGLYGSHLEASGRRHHVGRARRKVDSVSSGGSRVSAETGGGEGDVRRGGRTKGRKSLGEIGSTWKTVRSCDSDSTPELEVNGIVGAGEEKTSKEADTSFVAGSHLGKTGEVSHAKTGKSAASQDFPVAPMRRKKAVAQPPGFVVVESGVNSSVVGSHPGLVSAQTRPITDLARLAAGSPSKEDVESDKIRNAVKKDSACYSMVDNMSDHGENGSRQLGNGSATGDYYSGNGRFPSPPADYRGHFPPILYVTPDSPRSTAGFNIGEQEYGLGEKSRREAELLNSENPNSKSAYDSISTPSNDKGTFGSEALRIKSPVGSSANSPHFSAPVITVQHEDGWRRNASIDEPSQAVTDSSLSWTSSGPGGDSARSNHHQDNLALKQTTVRPGNNNEKIEEILPRTTHRNGQVKSLAGPVTTAKEKPHKFPHKPPRLEALPSKHQTVEHPVSSRNGNCAPVHDAETTELTSPEDCQSLRPDKVQLGEAGRAPGPGVRVVTNQAPGKVTRARFSSRRARGDSDELPRIEIT